MTKIDIWKNKSRYTSTTSPYDPRLKKQENSVIKRARKGTHKYNTRSKVNHVTTFKNTPQMFKKDMKNTSTTHIESEYIAKTDPKKGTITVEPVSHHITCETTGKS